MQKPGALEKASISVVTLMFVLLMIVLSVWLYSSYTATIRQGNERVTAASKIVAANAIWMNSLARQTLHRVDESLVDPLATPDHIHDLNAAVADLPSQVFAYVHGPDGQTLFSNNRDIKQVDVTDREYFVRLKNGADEYVSSLIQSKISGKQIFVFSRRLDRKGAFAGIAVVAFDGDILRPVWDTVAMGQNSTVSLVRRDGQLIARHPEPDGPVDMRDFVLFTDYARKATSGIYRAHSPVDQDERLVAYQIIERTPFVAIASADIKVIMLPFWRDVETASILVALASMGAIAAALWIRSLIRNDDLHRRQLAEALAANQTLLREVHHRVKNNMQTVMALLRMQGFESNAVGQLTERISAMSAVHEQMYGFDQFVGLAARDFIPSFVRKLVDVHGRNIDIDLKIDDVVIAADKATPFALLLNEIVANSMKYAFNDRPLGRLTVILTKIDEAHCQLIVADDGPGYDGNSSRPGMGSRLIRAFVSQMQGQSGYTIANGTMFTATLHTAQSELPSGSK